MKKGVGLFSLGFFLFKHLYFMWDFPKFSGVFSLLCFGSIWTISMFSSFVTFVEVRETIMTKCLIK